MDCYQIATIKISSWKRTRDSRLPHMRLHGAQVIGTHRTFDQDESSVRIRFWRSGDRRSLWRWGGWKLFAGSGVMRLYVLKRHTAGDMVISNGGRLWWRRLRGQCLCGVRHDRAHDLSKGVRYRTSMSASIRLRIRSRRDVEAMLKVEWFLFADGGKKFATRFVEGRSK
jgi:hypothetical protein